MTTESVPDPVGVQKPTDTSAIAERSIDGDWTRPDTISGSINPDFPSVLQHSPRSAG